jgi:outer membrane protein TolC
VGRTGGTIRASTDRTFSLHDQSLEAFVSKSFSVLAAAGFVLATATSGAAQESNDKVKALIAEALAQSGQTMTALQSPGSATQAGPMVSLTVDEAVARALERNLDLQVQRLNPRLTNYSLAGILAGYKPTLTSNFVTERRTSLPASQLQALGSSQTNDQTLQWNSGVQQNMKWGGGNLNVRFNNSRSETTNPAATRNPGYNSNIFATYTQPLLRNFKIDNTRFSLTSARLNLEIEDINLKTTITNTEASVRNAYWDLVFAVQAIEAARRSLDLSSKLVADNRMRVEIGTMAPIDVVQAQAEEAARRQALVNAENTFRTNELALKRLLVSGADDELWKATLNPTDRPEPGNEPIDLEQAVANALQSRTDLEIARKNVALNDVSLKNIRNQTLPDLSLVTNYQLQGRGGTELKRSGIGGAVTERIPGGYFDALETISKFTAPTWSFQLNLSYPIGTSAAEYSLARARVQLQQTQAQIKQAELQVASDVTLAAINVRNMLEAVEAAQVSRELSDKRLEAAQSKFDVGMATNFEVVQAQRDLADARNSELRQLLNYRKALVDFQRSQITGSARNVTSIR